VRRSINAAGQGIVARIIERKAQRQIDAALMRHLEMHLRLPVQEAILRQVRNYADVSCCSSLKTG